jgi:SARP family transcriptional regulator, regulator of embCAB operon
LIKLEMLGPAQFWYEDRRLDFRPLEKLVHIALLVGGGTLSSRQLAEDVWVVPTPGSASTLRGCLSKSRARLVAAGGTAEQLSRTIRISGGRTLVSIPEEWDVDADRLKKAAAAASVAYESGQFGEAQAWAAAALKLWYDDPLPDAGQRPFAISYIEELKGIHWSVTLIRIKTDICLGWHREVIAELERLTLQRPNEGEVRMLLAIALYRSDRIPEAVEVCRQAIAAREGKGIEAHRLQDLQHAMLTGTAPPRGPLGW